MKYTRSGVQYILSNTDELTNPGGFNITDTASVNGNALVINVTNHGHGGNYKYVSDSYYGR